MRMGGVRVTFRHRDRDLARCLGELRVYDYGFQWVPPTTIQYIYIYKDAVQKSRSEKV